MSTLYLVATPIGNLEDISARALRVLREVTLIAAEDTRHTRKLLSHYDIHTDLTSYYEHNKRHKLEHVLEKLAGGDVALVSDAGTPALNDPGFLLVRAALDAGHKVSPIPGASAPVAALVVSGLPTDRFLYLGYLPRKQSDRKSAIAEVAALPYTLIFLETPHRLLDSLLDLQAELGDRQVAVASELTKLYEETFRGALAEAAAHFEQYPARGEFTLVVEGASEEVEEWSAAELEKLLRKRLQGGEPLSAIAKDVATQTGWPRRQIYQQLTELQSEKE
jgi:16S rRNA (cytidine1402-2'-O)-methyltransferase